MRKVRDYEKTFRGLHSDGGVVRVRLYEDGTGGEEPVVVLSDPPANQNTSITNLFEVLAAETAQELGVVGAGTRFVEHYPRSGLQTRCGIPEEFALVTFSGFEGAEEDLGVAKPTGRSLVEVRQTMVGGVWRPSFGTPNWQHVGRGEVAALLGEDVGGEVLPEPEPEEPEQALAGPGEKTPLDMARAREHRMDLSLEWEVPDGDVILKRVPDFERGLDLADHLQTTLQTNVAWSVVEHSPSGWEFGYGGSGPADLALNLLNMFTPPEEDGLPPVRCFEGAASRTAWDLHQSFKRVFVAPLDRYADHCISGAEIREWIEANRERQEPSW